MHRKSILPLVFTGFGIILALCTAGVAHASERRFTYVYETGVLNPGDIEVEPWLTWRYHRESFYSRLEASIELEIGLTDRLQTALYLNAKTINKAVPGNGLQSESEFSGITSEWKFELSDPVADVIGSALYLEFSGGPTEVELEAKVLLDKRFGALLLAVNLVGEFEWEFEQVEVETKAVVRVVAGAAYFITDRLALGLELLSDTAFRADGLTHSALFAGPTLSYAADRWWVAVTVMPQLPAIYRGPDPSADSLLVLDDHEYLTSRLLVGVHL